MLLSIFRNHYICGRAPRITLLTPICESGNRSTLIDNIFTNIIDGNKMHTSGNLLNAITDIKAMFTLVDSIKYNDPPPKFIKTEVNDDKSLQTFVHELKQLNVYKSLDTNLQNDLNQYYDICEKLLLYAKTKHLTTKTIFFLVNISTKKYKLITNGILKSIKNKDTSYILLVKTDCTNSTYMYFV